MEALKSGTFVVTIALLALLASCVPSAPTELEFKDGKLGDDISSDDGDSTPTNNGDGGSNIPTGTLYEQVNGIIVSNCTTCHNNSLSQGGVSLIFHNEQELLDSGLIEPGVPLNSQLYKSVKGIDDALLMPPAKRLSSGNVSIIETYITSLKVATSTQLAALNTNRSFYDPQQVAIGIRCLEDGEATYRILQNGTKIKDGKSTCVKGQTIVTNVPMSALTGLSASTITVDLLDKAKLLESMNLVKVPAITQIPAATNSCAANAVIVPKFALKRLSQIQIQNILIDVFAEFGVNASAAVLASSGYLMQDSASDGLLGTEFFPKNDLSYGKQNIEGISNFFKNVIIQLEKTATIKTTIENAQCSSLSMSLCMNKIVDEVTVRLMRGQLDSTTIAALKTDAATFQSKYDGIIGLIEYAFLHPRFGFELYFKNVGSSTTGATVAFTSEELLYKSFLTVFNTVPTAAQLSQWYMSGLSYHQYVINLAADGNSMETKFQKNLSEFFSGWFKLDPNRSIASKTFAQELKTLIPSGLQSTFKKNSIANLATYLGQQVVDGSLDIYGLHFWDSQGVSSMPFSSIMDFSNGDVPLAALPPLLFSSFEYNNIFARGANVYKRLFCGNFSGIGQPSDIVAQEESVTHGTREHFESLTPKGSSCFACHQKFNAIGYNLEEFSVMGAPRTDGYEYQYNTNGTISNSNPIKIDGHMEYSNQFYHTPNIKALYQEMYNKGVLKKCTTKQVGQYFLKMKDTTANKCALEKINQSPTNDIRQIIFNILTSDSFTKVTL